MSRSQRILGSIIEGVGSLVALFAFFSLPSILIIDFPTTALRLTTETAAQYGGLLSWLEGGLAAILLLGIVVQGLRRLTTEKAGVRPVISLAALALLVLLIEYLGFLPGRVAYLEVTRQIEPHANSASTGSSPAYYLGPGFWFYLVGMVLVLVGGVVSMRAGKDVDLRQEGAWYLKVRMFMSRSQWNFVSTITGIGGLLACFAFFFLPYVTTASRTNTGVSLLTTTAFQHAVAGEWAFLFVGFVAPLTLVIAGWQVFRDPNMKVLGGVGRALLFVLLGSLTLLILFNLYRSPLVVSHSITRIATSSTTSFTCDSGTVGGPFSPTTTDTCIEAALSPYYGPGFWFYVLGMVLVVVGSIVQAGMALLQLLTRFPKQTPAG